MQPDPRRGAPPDTLIDLICLPVAARSTSPRSCRGQGPERGGQVVVMFCLGAEREDGAVKDGAEFHYTAAA